MGELVKVPQQASGNSLFSDPVTCFGMAACLLVLAWWLNFLTNNMDGPSPGELTEIQGEIVHVSAWRAPGRFSDRLAVIQLAQSAVRVSTTAVSAEELNERLRGKKMICRAIIKKPAVEAREPSPVKPAWALWIDDQPVLTMQQFDSNNKTSRSALRTAAAGLIGLAFFLLLKGYASQRERRESTLP